MTWDSVQELIQENEPTPALEAVGILLRLSNNIIKNPSEQKCRRIRLKNPFIENSLLPVVGALRCLFDMGFLEDGEFLTMPQGSSLSVLTAIRDDLNKAQAVLSKSNNQEKTETSRSTSVQQISTQSSQDSTSQQSIPLQISSETESSFFKKIHYSLKHVKVYEDHNLQEKARSVIPIATLQKEAQAKLDSSRSAGQSETIDLQDCLLLCLMDWFKNSFFSWVDAPPCERCGSPTTSVGMDSPTFEERRWEASRVEYYRCNQCTRITRFPRYNHPGKLLETRRGRCGEWANCFTLCCRAMGFEARYVLDWSDHVWTEVYSQFQQRWLHCDPCENVCDNPLLYESGWGKSLTYVFAFSKDDLMDVTWRYSGRHAEVRNRRTECRELILVKAIHQINKQKRSMMAPARQQVMLNRTVVELVEFLTEKTSNASGLSGRTSGSLAWRLARGETGSRGTKEPFTFTPSEKEQQLKKIHVKYNCAKNVYLRISSNNEEINDWTTLCFESNSIARKEEKDWKMVYLARSEGSQNASITWKFDVSGSNLKINKVHLKAESSVFENGLIKWKVCGDDQCVMLNAQDVNSSTSVDVKGSTSLTIMASLSQGVGNVAWQHTQLFRQSSNDFNNFPLEIEILLM